MSDLSRTLDWPCRLTDDARREAVADAMAWGATVVGTHHDLQRFTDGWCSRSCGWRVRDWLDWRWRAGRRARGPLSAVVSR